MKRLFCLLAVLAASAGFVSCESPIDGPEPETDQDYISVSQNGNTVTFKYTSGTHTYTLNEGEQTSTLTFSHFPSTLNEFKTLRERLLGKSRPGTVALCLLSFEMYRRNQSVGEQCVRLINTSANATITIPRLKDKLDQPYLVASYLKGATQSNNYTPNEPYVLTFLWNDNPNVVQGEYSSSYAGKVYHYYAVWNGDGKRDATVLSPDDGSEVIVHGCGNLVLGVPTVGGWTDTLK